MEGGDEFALEQEVDDFAMQILGKGMSGRVAGQPGCQAGALFSRIVGAITFQVLEEVSPKRVTMGSDAGSNRALCIDLIGVRPRYQGLGLGKFLIKYLQSGNFLPEGPFCALLAFPDDRSVGFFQTCGFDADPILNSHFMSRSNAHRLWKNSTQV